MTHLIDSFLLGFGVAAALWVLFLLAVMVWVTADELRYRWFS